ncbi:MAG: hypothetical protein ACE5EQ_05410 [Phycisphaerae bacterium]
MLDFNLAQTGKQKATVHVKLRMIRNGKCQRTHPRAAREDRGGRDRESHDAILVRGRREARLHGQRDLRAARTR